MALDESSTRPSQCTLWIRPAALAAATDAKAVKMLLLDGQKALDDAIARRFASRTALALSKMEAASATEPIACDVTALGKCIEVAEKEMVDEARVTAAKKHHVASFKSQSEGALEPLSRTQTASAGPAGGWRRRGGPTSAA